ncbi:MAG: DUF4276 family protein [Novipirellula sp. JB048]
MRFEIISEGETEKDSIAQFLKRWLDPRLSQPVGIKVSDEKGFARALRKISTKAKAKLDAPGNEDIIGVIGLIDLYGPEFPDHVTSVADRYSWFKDEIERDVDDDRFRMHFAVHEVEAWLLADKSIFPRPVQDIWPSNLRPPEQVNFNEPPAKLLNKLYKQATRKTYKKTVNGKQLFGKLDVSSAVAACPYLKLLLDDMLDMAKAKGL